MICISQIAKGVEHFFKCLSTILYFSVEIFLFRSVLRVFFALFALLMTSFLSSSYIWGISPLSNEGLMKVFSHSVGCHFVLLTVSFALQKLLGFKRSHLLFLSVSVLLALY